MFDYFLKNLSRHLYIFVNVRNIIPMMQKKRNIINKQIFSLLIIIFTQSSNLLMIQTIKNLHFLRV